MTTSDKKNAINRRTFLKTAAGAGAGAALGGALSLNLKALQPTTASNPSFGKGEWKSTTCQGCTSWCSIQAYVVDGRVVKVRGNPDSKVNLGNVCSKSHFSIQQLYDPDRIKTPLKRTNPKKGRGENPGFVPITWDEALDVVADKLMELRRDSETHKFLFFRGRYSYMRDIIYDRIPKIVGSPNNISHSSICAEAEKFGPYFTEGFWNYRQYDVLNAKYILLWGADPLSSNRQVSYYLSVWGDVLENAEVAVADPRLSASASKADIWLPVKPGEDGALASAIAHTILTEGLWNREFVGDFAESSPVRGFTAGIEIPEEFYDESGRKQTPTFVENFTHGLIKWWNIELKDKTPEWAAEKAGLSAADIRKVAVGFGKAAPHSICWMGGGPAMQVRGAYASMAIHALNGLVGSVDNVGGTLAANKEYSIGFPDAADFIDDIAKAGAKHKKIDKRGSKEFPAMTEGKPGGGVVTNNAADGILNEDPNEIKVCVAYMNNFAFSCPQTGRWEAALAKIPFTAHITTNASEFTWFADIVLPSAHTAFEKWGYVKNHANGYRHVTLLEPVIEPVWDVRMDETEIPWMLAEKLAARGFDNLLRHYKEYKDPETGKTPTNGKEFSLYAIKHATQKLWDPAQHEGGDKFSGWEEFVKTGVWNSDPYKHKARWGKMATATGKFEFYSETLKESLGAHAANHETTIDDILETCKYQARGEKAFVPHYEEPYVRDGDADYPFALVDYKSRLNREGRSANCHWYQDFKDLDPGDEKWDDVAKINPIDANALGIKNGDRIDLISSTGKLTCSAKLWEGTQPGTIAKCYGQGHWAYGAVAAKEFGKEPRGGNNNEIIPAEYERLSGSSVYYGLTKIKVVKSS